LYDTGAGLEYVQEMLSSAGRRWNGCEALAMLSEADGQRTSHEAALSREENLTHGVQETFKWMTTKRGSSKYARTGLYHKHVLCAYIGYRMGRKVTFSY